MSSSVPARFLRSVGLTGVADRIHRASVVIAAAKQDLQVSDWLQWRPLRASFFLATLGNAVMLGFDAEGFSGGLYSALSHFFGAVLVLEIACSVYSYGVWILAVDLWLLWNLATVHVGLWVWRNDLLRILGVFRLVDYAASETRITDDREVQLSTVEKFLLPLRKLTQGVMRGFSTLLWSLVVIGVSVFFFGTVAETILASDDSEVKQIYFGDLSKSMFSLFQMLTMSGWSQSIVRKFVEKGDTVFAGVMIFYILFSALIVMNLLTAVIIEGAFSDLEHEEQQQAFFAQNRQGRIIDEVKIMLTEAVPPTAADPECIKKDEFERLSQHSRKFQYKLGKLGVSPEEYAEIFQLFDENHTGLVNIEELCAGFVKLKANINAKDIFSCVAHLKALTGSLEKISDAQGYRALLMPLERLEREILPQFSDDIAEVLTNIDRTLVNIQKQSMGQLTDSIKTTLPPKPSTPPKPERQFTKKFSQAQSKSSSNFLGSEGFSEAVASSPKQQQQQQQQQPQQPQQQPPQQQPQKRLRFAEDN